MKERDGLFRRTPNGDWYWRARVNGKLIRESTRQKDKRKAEAIRNKRMTEIAMFQHFPTRRFEKVTFGDLIETWIRAKSKRAETFVYELPLVREKFGKLRARDLTTAMAEDFLNGLELSASRKNHYRTILNGVFNAAVGRKEYDENPVHVIPQFKEPPGRERFLSPQEFQALLAGCGEDIELWVAILVHALTTLRMREFLNRKWTDIHLSEPVPYISVPVTKNGRPKKVPLPKVAVAAILRLPSYGTSEYVFPCTPNPRFPNPRKPYRWDMGRKFRAVVRKLGLEDLRFHDLRAVGPSILMELGIPDALVRKITGHTSRELERYQRPSAQLKAQTVDLVANQMFLTEGEGSIPPSSSAGPDDEKKA